MTVQSLLEEQLREGLEPVFLEVINESPRHNVPSNSESHFRALIVSEKFTGLTLIERQRLVHNIIADQIRGSIHAFSQKTLTPEEFKERGGKLSASPPCAKKSLKS